MKKLFFIGVMSTLLLTACGEEKASPDANKSGLEKEVAQEVKSEYPFPESDLIGEATITVSTPAGDSSNGNVPVLFVESDDILTQIGIDYENFDGNIETYVYINKIFYSKEQAGELMQSSLSLSENNLKPGDYTVTAVQFTDNDPTKEPVTVSEAKFKIEESK